MAAAFVSGSLSYSKVRAITRVDAEAGCDRWLLHLAGAGTVADLERAVHHWADLRDQERGLDDYLRRFEKYTPVPFDYGLQMLVVALENKLTVKRVDLGDIPEIFASGDPRPMVHQLRRVIFQLAELQDQF